MAAQAGRDITMLFPEKPLIIAATDGMVGRQNRRDNRGDRHDTRQDCRDEEEAWPEKTSGPASRNSVRSAPKGDDD
jgi:hypothetical protein